MIKKNLLTTLRVTFFNNNKKNPIDKPAAPQKPTNKRYLIQAALQSNKSKPLLLPPSPDPSKLTVVLEMDEVLSFTFTPDDQGYLLAPRRKHDYHLWFEQYECLLNIYKRKNLDNFLNYLAQQCQPVVWSTGVRSYVELVMGLIDPTRRIKHILSQQHCTRVVQQQSEIDQYLKDLNLLGRDMSRVVYIDSKTMAFWMHPRNGLAWQEFKADNSMKWQDMDMMLLQVQNCRKAKDCRDYLLEEYGLEEEFKDADLL